MYCKYCDSNKELIEFSLHNKTTMEYNSMCKICKNEYNKRWYHKNSSKHKKLVRKNCVKEISKNKNFLDDYLKDKACVDCGINDIIVLEFDHIRR